MSEILAPATAEQLREAIAWAADSETPLEIIGEGTKRSVGRPASAETVLSTAAIKGIRAHEPEELILTAGPGTPMVEIEFALQQSRQRLAFEPPDLGRLLGAEAETATLGGTVAANLAGPRRIQAGAARDHFLGFEAVSGRGEIFKAGGKVVKNVTGYDLCKLICGSWGTLAVLTELTLKVLPIPERTRTVLIFGCGLAEAGEVMTIALQSPYDVSGAAYLPSGVAAQSRIGYVAQSDASVTAIRIEGTGASVEYRCEQLRRALEGYGETEELHSANSNRLWTEICDVAAFVGDARAVWKISVPPAAGPALAQSFAGLAESACYLDWGGGLLWLALPEGEDAGAATLRQAVGQCGGHATLIRASEPLRKRVDPFPPPPALPLQRRIKQGFDPKAILNPGRLGGGI